MTGPESAANRSPAFGEPVGLGLGLGEPVGVAVGEGLGEPVGEPVGDGLGLAHGDALGDGLGVPAGEPVGDGLAEPNVPASTTVEPFSTCTCMPDVMTGTCCPLSVRRVKRNVPQAVTLVCPITALLIDTDRVVPDGRLIDEPSTSSRWTA